MMPLNIPTITHHDPRFLKAAYASKCIALHNSVQFVKNNERYIMFDPKRGKFRVHLRIKNHICDPFCGSFMNIEDAVFKAQG